MLSNSGFLVGTLLCLALAHSQESTTPTSSLTFEVVSIKVNSSGMGSSMVGCRGVDTQVSIQTQIPLGRCRAVNAPVKSLIGMAYQLSFEQLDSIIVDGPSWINTERFDIDAKAEDAATTTQGQLLSMMGRLLADHFKLAFHREMREVPGYLLLLAPAGHKLEEASGNEVSPGFNMRNAQVTVMNVPIARLTTFIAGRVRRPVIDKTGLTKTYNFRLDTSSFGAAVDVADTSNVSMFTVLQEELGLRLQAQKVPFRVMVIDSIMRPHQN